MWSGKGGVNEDLNCDRQVEEKYSWSRKRKKNGRDEGWQVDGHIIGKTIVEQEKKKKKRQWI